MSTAGQACWPKGKNCGVGFTFDFDVDTFIVVDDPSAAGRPGTLSQGLYEPKRGVPLILELLEKHTVKATFFVPGEVAVRFPDSVRSIVDRGHEIAVHGYTHRSPTDLTPDEEEDELVRAREELERFQSGVTGYRSPSWDFSLATLGLLQRHGFGYSSNLMDDVLPYRHEGTDVVELPVQWILDDAAYWWMDLGNWTKSIFPPSTVEEIWRGELDGIARLGGACIFTMHPAVTGRPGRLAFLDRLLEHVLERQDLFVGTCSELAGCVPGAGAN